MKCIEALPPAGSSTTASVVHADGAISVAKRQRSIRSGICRASPNDSASQRNRPAPRPVRADRRHVSRAGHPPDLEVFLPPIGGTTVYMFGDPELAFRSTLTTCRVHDECNGSDVFGSDICTCRPI